MKDDQLLVDETDVQVDIAVKASPGTNTAELMTEKMARVKVLYIEIEALSRERHLALENVLEACDKFWDGVEQLKISLGGVKRHLDTHDPPAAELHHIEEQIHEHEVGTDLDVKLNKRFDVYDVSDYGEITIESPSVFRLAVEIKLQNSRCVLYFPCCLRYVNIALKCDNISAFPSRCRINWALLFLSDII